MKLIRRSLLIIITIMMMVIMIMMMIIMIMMIIIMIIIILLHLHVSPFSLTRFFRALMILSILVAGCALQSDLAKIQLG